MERKEPFSAGQSHGEIEARSESRRSRTGFLDARDALGPSLHSEAGSRARSRVSAVAGRPRRGTEPAGPRPRGRVNTGP